MLAAVDEGIVELQLGDVAHRARDGDAAGLSHRLDTRGDIDAVAEDALGLLVDDDLAQMHADAEHQPLVFVEHGVEL
jgi:hypothetical protein